MAEWPWMLDTPPEDKLLFGINVTFQYHVLEILFICNDFHYLSHFILFCFVLSHNYPPVALASVIHLTQCIHASLEIVICYSCCFPFIVQQDQYLSVFASCLRPLEEPIDCLSCRALIHFLHVMSVCFVSL